MEKIILGLKRKKLLLKIFILVFIILLLSSYIYEKITNDVPSNIPDVTIKYNGESITTSFGEYTWLQSFSKDQPKAGNSYLVGLSYDVGMTLSRFSAKPNSYIEVIFDSAPPEILLRTWVVGDTKNETSTKLNSSRKINTITLPDKKGEYIYEVQGYWSNTNFTSTIFRVLVE